jgi:hypothetical protein
MVNFKEKKYKPEKWEDISLKEFTDPGGHKLKIKIDGKYESITVPCKSCNKEFELKKSEVEKL